MEPKKPERQANLVLLVSFGLSCNLAETCHLPQIFLELSYRSYILGDLKEQKNM